MIISDVACLLKGVARFAVVAAKGDFEAAKKLKETVQNLRFCTKNDNFNTDEKIKEFFCKGYISVEGTDIYNDQFSNRREYSNLKEVFLKEDWKKW